MRGQGIWRPIRQVLPQTEGIYLVRFNDGCEAYRRMFIGDHIFFHYRATDGYVTHWLQEEEHNINIL